MGSLPKDKHTGKVVELWAGLLAGSGIKVSAASGLTFDDAFEVSAQSAGAAVLTHVNL